jgi:hypothetical protein
MVAPRPPAPAPHAAPAQPQHAPALRKVARAAEPVAPPEATVKNAPTEPMPAPEPQESAEETPSPPLFDGPTGMRVGVGGVGSLSGGDAVPGAWVFADFGYSRLGVETALYGTTFHSVAGPGPGRSEWTRMAGAVGPRYRIKADAVTLDLRAAVAAGWFWVHGHGFADNETNRTWAIGGGAGARLSLERSSLAPWIGIDGMAWPGTHDIVGVVAGVPEAKAIPAIDILMSLGFSLKLF